MTEGFSRSALNAREFEMLRHLLRGESIIDWRGALFNSRDEVDRFLYLHLIDWRDPEDQALLFRILKEAVDYLRSVFHYRVADAVAEPVEIQDLFLYASGLHPRHPKKYQKIACVVLKVMHVIFYTESRDLLFRTPIASSVLHQLVDERVMSCAKKMYSDGVPVVQFSGSVKTHHSMITKLLAKKENVSAQVFDKVRYRIIVKEKEDVLPVLGYLINNLFPHNLVVASQTENSLVDLSESVGIDPLLKTLVEKIHRPLDPRLDRLKRSSNPYSGNEYRVLNIVVDLPVRIDSYASGHADARPGSPRVVLSWVEFQISDLNTSLSNESGESSHDAYKNRQKAKVLKRLSRGLVKPRIYIQD